MRKLLNTLYVTKENGYLSLDGENLVLTIDGKEAIRLPFTNIESVVCMNYLGCSPALMGKCAKENIGLCFISPNGRFLARVTGEVKGNVFLRYEQIKLLESAERQADIVRNIITAKIKNTKNLILRSRRDNKEIDSDERLTHTLDILDNNIAKIQAESDMDVLRGIEGQSAKAYFDIFDRLITKQMNGFHKE